MKYAGSGSRVAGGLPLSRVFLTVMVSDGFTVGYIRYHSLEDFVSDWEVAECCDS